MWEIYHCFCVNNGKHYVGLTKHTRQKRWHGHVKASRAGSINLLHKAIRKHGEHSFVMSLLSTCSSEKEACVAERYWVSYFNSNDCSYGYNMTAGGEGSLNLQVSVETRKKMSVSHSGKIFTEEHKRRLSESNIGKHDHKGSNHPSWGKRLSQSERKIMSDALKGKLTGERNPRFGVTVTVETRQKMRETQQKKHAEKRIAIMNAFNRGLSRKEIAIELSLNVNVVRYFVRECTRKQRTAYLS